MNSWLILAGGLLTMAIVIAATSVLARASKFYRRELSEVENREIALDGLRGMAALMVVTHHAALYCTYIVGDAWGVAGSSVFQIFGPAGVTLFFLLTGYLFWSKARKGKGKLNAWKLWRGRLYRIGPLYLFSLLIVLLLAVSQTGTSWLTLGNWQPFLRLLTLGALNWHNVGPVNLLDYNSVVWTLHYEWQFYLILPFIAWLATGRRTYVFAGVVGVLFLFPGILSFLYSLVHRTDLNLTPCLVFTFGMLSAVLLENEPVRHRLTHPLAAGVALALAVLACGLNPNASFSGALCCQMFPVFLVAAAGNKFFGFLTHPATRCLGAISFSVYLLHCLVFFLAFHVIKMAGWTDRPEYCYWPVFWVSAVAVVLLCSFTYRWIEFPFLSISHKRGTKPSSPR